MTASKPISANPPNHSNHSTSNCFTFCPIWVSVLLSCLSWAVPLAIARPTHAAERIYVTYNILERSISVASLEAYAKQGIIDDDLAAYARYANPSVLKELRTALLSKSDLKLVTVAQFLYSPQGEAALKRLGQIIQPESRQPGYKAIRSALILSAADPDGLTLLNFLKKFPARGIRIDVERSLQVVQEAEQLINQTRKATQTIIDLAQTEASLVSPLAPNLADLRQRGPFSFQKQSITLTDPNRQTVSIAPTQPASAAAIVQGRTYPVDIYLPEPSRAKLPSPIPVVLISHGLGSDRSSFAYLAEHLASYGFAVLVPEHPGSDRRQMEALLQGIASEVAEPTEFANRPLDITYLLNYFERQASTNVAYQNLNLKQVGVIGQSFGGYTALALAGAPISFEQLQKDCPGVENTFNISLLLQCRAQELAQATQPRTDFRDPRVQAVIAMNPIDSAVMGQTNLGLITVPTMIVTGSADTVAPSLFEQVRPFTWLSSSDKYLVQMDPGTHFSVIGGSDVPGGGGALEIPPEVVGPNPAIAQRYVNALALAFFQTHIANQPTYRSYLNAAYAQSISDPTLRLVLVRTLTPDQLTADQRSPNSPL
ncbi:MAG: alpha/beta hydrolase [Oscillatoriales cyanobacterium C42_A2020_001]|nr:alpha/beta hydrolase [Leptolyngbyaceae cyanobacterium C42_A2020_001]